MFKLERGQRSSVSSDSFSLERTRRRSDECDSLVPDVDVDDPLICRLNHRRELIEEKKKKNEQISRLGCESVTFMGWGHDEKDPFDLESTSSDDEELDAEHPQHEQEQETVIDRIEAGPSDVVANFKKVEMRGNNFQQHNSSVARDQTSLPLQVTMHDKNPVKISQSKRNPPLGRQINELFESMSPSNSFSYSPTSSRILRRSSDSPRTNRLRFNHRPKRSSLEESFSSSTASKSHHQSYLGSLFSPISLCEEASKRGEECPRLLQLKQQSTDELRHELEKIQIQSKSNLERSWAEAERLRVESSALDEKLVELKAKIDEAATDLVSCALDKKSTAQDARSASSMPHQMKPRRTTIARSSSGSALSRLTGYFSDDNSRVDDAIDTRSIGTASQASKFQSEYSQDDVYGEARSVYSYSRQFDSASCCDESDIIASALMDGPFDRDHQSCVGRFVPEHTSTADNHSTAGSTVRPFNIDAVNRTGSDNIFHVEAMALTMQDLCDQLSKRSEELSNLRVVLQMQDLDIENCREDIKRLLANEDVKKLEEIESIKLLELDDFNRCFLSLDSKLQSIEGIRFDLEEWLEKSSATSVESFLVDKNRLEREKEEFSDVERRSLMDTLNNPSLFKHYRESRKEIEDAVLRMQYLEADLRTHLVNIRLFLDRTTDEEGTQTTASSMASERCTLERVFVESIIPHVEFAQITGNNLLFVILNNVKILKWWNHHFIDQAESFRTSNGVLSSSDFIINEPSLSLTDDMQLLELALKVTSESLSVIQSDVRQECNTFRSNIESAGLYGHGVSERSLFQKNTDEGSDPDTLELNDIISQISKQLEVIEEKEKIANDYASQLEMKRNHVQQQLKNQLQMLDDLHVRAQSLSSKHLELDSLMSSLSQVRRKKERRIHRFRSTIRTQLN